MSDTLLLDAIYNSTGDITNIRHRIPGYTGSYHKYTPVLKPKTNIISTLKQFRVQRDEFSVLCDILSIIAYSCIPDRDTGSDDTRTFQLTDRQGSFTNKYLVTGLSSSINITSPITIHVSPGNITFTINIIPQTKLSYIRHELVNPLHTIKLSSILIKNQKTDIDKLGDLIASKVDESICVLDGLLAIGKTSRLDPIDISTFLIYINDYIMSINQAYSQSIKPQIIWSQVYKPNCKTQGITLTSTTLGGRGTIYVNTCYIKVILDNVFKNIFGHLNNRILDREFRDFIVKIDSPASILAPTPAYIHIIISNRILNSTARPAISTPFIFSKHSSISKLQGIYHLDPSSHINSKALINPIINKSGDANNGTLDPGVSLNTLPLQRRCCSLGINENGTGIRLIDELCKKMNIQWQIQESDDTTAARDPIVSFSLKIPITHYVYRRTKQVQAPEPVVSV